MVLEAGEALNLSYKIRPNGTYCFVSGPCYESKAECRFLRSLGGDSVGMSTIPEVIAAKHCGMQILGLSLITNAVVMGNEDTPAASHAEVLAAVDASGMHVEAIVRRIINKNVIGPYLAEQPKFEYTHVPAAVAAAGGQNPTAAAKKAAGSCGCGANCNCGPDCNCGANAVCCGNVINQGAAAGSCCGPKKSSCCGGELCNTLVTLGAVTAVAAGLFYVLKNRHH